MDNPNQMDDNLMTKQELISRIEKYYLLITVGWVNHLHRNGWLKHGKVDYELIDADNEITRGRWYTLRLNQVVNEPMSDLYLNPLQILMRSNSRAERKAQSALDSLDYRLLWDANVKLAETLIDVDTIHTSTTMSETFDRVRPALEVYRRMMYDYPISIKIQERRH